MQQRQFDWEIAEAKAKYDEARGTPEVEEAGGGCFKDGGQDGGDPNQRAMIHVQGWYLFTSRYLSSSTICFSFFQQLASLQLNSI